MKEVRKIVLLRITKKKGSDNRIQISKKVIRKSRIL